MSRLQFDMFGDPEDIDSYPERDRLRDDAPVPSERELLWPEDLAQLLGAELLEKLYGDIPRRSRLTVKEVCRRCRIQKSHCYELVDIGSLDASDVSNPNATKEYVRIYRYSVVTWLFSREFILAQTRSGIPAADLDRCLDAAKQLSKTRRTA